MPQLIRHLSHQEKVTLDTSILRIALFTDLGKASVANGGGFVGFGARTADVGERHFWVGLGWVGLVGVDDGWVW